MATIADKLTTIAGIKTDIRTAINGKGGSLTSGSPFSAYSAAISSLPSGGGGGASSTDWSQIGYTGAPQSVQDAFSYAKTIYDNWDPTVRSLYAKFSGDTSIVYMPMVETSAVTSTEYMFYNAKNLVFVPNITTSGVTNMSYMFYHCSGLTESPSIDTRNVTTMVSMYEGCTGLKTVHQLNMQKVTSTVAMFKNCTSLTASPLNSTTVVLREFNGTFSGCSNLSVLDPFDASKVENMSESFYNCRSLKVVPELNSSACTNMYRTFYSTGLEKITSLDISKVTSIGNMFQGTGANLRFMLLKGLGTPSGMTSYTGAGFQWCSVWGVADSTYTDARQSLVDTLLTYSYDRSAAGFQTCTIKLSSNSYNQLTAQEIADIEAKGYTLTT